MSQNDYHKGGPVGGSAPTIFADRPQESPFTRQVAGSHYRDMAMQPFQFSMRNRWDGAAHSILKYVSRHRTKNGLIDVQKGRHIVDIRLAEIAYSLPGNGLIPMATYIDVNGIEGEDAEALMALEGWVERRLPETTLIRVLDEMITTYHRACSAP